MSEQTKHTPGPWRIDYGTFAVVADHPTGHDQDMNLLYYNGHLVCESIKREANAHLIAASPDLLEAAKLYIAAIDSDPENDIWDTWDGKPAEGAQKTASDASWADHGQKIEARLSELRAAIAKAEGRE